MANEQLNASFLSNPSVSAGLTPNRDECSSKSDSSPALQPIKLEGYGFGSKRRGSTTLHQMEQLRKIAGSNDRDRLCAIEEDSSSSSSSEDACGHYLDFQIK